MNSKLLFFFLVLLISSSCGVKSPPLTYPDTVVDSYLKDFYPHNNQTTPTESKESLKNSEESVKQSPP